MIATRKAGEVAWYAEWFGRQYLELYAHRDRQEAVSDINKLERLLELRRDLPILDLACGGGRHSIELAARGYEVIGLDLSEELLEVAKSTAGEAGVSVRFVQGDKRSIPFVRTFGCVLNLFTSFGYFTEEKDNLAVLEGIRRSLVPGGIFLIDHLNRDYVLAHLVPEDVRELNGKRIVQRRRFDETSGRVEKEIEVDEGGARQCFHESVRLYSPDEFSEMASRAGLRITSIRGDLDGSDFGAESKRMIVMGERPS